MKIQTFTKIICFATFISCNFQGSYGNPIIENAEKLRNTPSHLINQPRYGGTTTLGEKCEAINYFQSINDTGGVLKITFQMGFEHPIDHLSIDEACSKVGVNTYLGY